MGPTDWAGENILKTAIKLNNGCLFVLCRIRAVTQTYNMHGCPKERPPYSRGHTNHGERGHVFFLFICYFTCRSKRENYECHSLEYKMDCLNCGRPGHSFRDCRAPITSFGICAVKQIENKHHYLLIQRRDSLGYVEFLRGKYKLDNPDYIMLLLNGMTSSERQRLLTTGFDKLWENLWNSQNTRQYRNEYEQAKKQFELLRTTGDVMGKLLHSYVAQASTDWPSPEWGFPKGRRSLHETELNCAIREFTEETGLHKTILHVCTGLDPYVEQYIGTNGITYKQVYYVAACKPDIEAVVQTANRVMTREVGNIGWFSYEDALSRIRTTNIEKRTLLTKMNTDMNTALGKERFKSALEWEPVTKY